MSNHRSAVHRYQIKGGRTNALDLSEPDIRRLAAAIILRAVNDWVELIYAEDADKRKGKPEKPKQRCKPRKDPAPGIHPDFDEIREFFHGPYGEMVCGAIDMESSIFIGRLEAWLNTYRSEGVLPSKIKMGG